MSTDEPQPRWSEATDGITIDGSAGEFEVRRHLADGTTRPLVVAVAWLPGLGASFVASCVREVGIDCLVFDRRRALAAAATKAFGGSCLAIDCGDVVTIDFADGDRFEPGPVVAERPGEDVSQYCAALDRAIVAAADASGADGPWLVITGLHAAVYVAHGRLPVQHVPDLVHRGLAELALQAG